MRQKIKRNAVLIREHFSRNVILNKTTSRVSYVKIYSMKENFRKIYFESEEIHMKQLINSFVGKMEKVDEVLEKIPGKTGVKLGAVVGVVAMTSPLAAGLAIGAAGAYGAYKLAKYAQENGDDIIDAEVVSPSQADE